MDQISMAVESKRQEFSMREECFGVSCTKCAKNSEVKQAIKYCIDCDKNLCVTCYQGHDGTMDGHILVDVNNTDHDNIMENTLNRCTDKLARSSCIDYSAEPQDLQSQVTYDRSHMSADCRNDLAIIGHKQKHTGGKYEAKLKGSIKVSLPGDSTYPPSDIVGCYLLSDGTLLLGDIGNMRFTHVTPSARTSNHHCEMEERVVIVSATNSRLTEARSSCRDLEIISLGNKIARNLKQRPDHFFRLVHSKGELFVTYIDSLYVYDGTGNLLRTICTGVSGQKMFHIITGICVSVTGEMIYIVDWSYGLVCLDRHGMVMFRRSHEDLGLSVAHGVCTDSQGNVFVCGYWSCNVVQVSKDGCVLGQITSENSGLVYPKCLCYDEAVSTLYVGGFRDKLVMFKLQ